MTSILSNAGITIAEPASCDSCNKYPASFEVETVTRNTCRVCVRRDLVLIRLADFNSSGHELKPDERAELLKYSGSSSLSVIDSASGNEVKIDVYEEVKGPKYYGISVLYPQINDENLDGALVLAKLESDIVHQTALAAINATGFQIQDQGRPLFVLSAAAKAAFPKVTSDLLLARQMCCPGRNVYKFGKTYPNGICRLHSVGAKPLPVVPAIVGDQELKVTTSPIGHHHEPNPIVDPVVSAFIVRQGESRKTIAPSIERLLKNRLKEIGRKESDIKNIKKTVLDVLSKKDLLKAAAAIKVMGVVDFGLKAITSNNPKPKNQKKQKQKKDGRKEKKEKKEEPKVTPTPSPPPQPVSNPTPSFDPMMMMLSSMKPELAPFMWMMRQQPQPQTAPTYSQVVQVPPVTPRSPKSPSTPVEGKPKKQEKKKKPTDNSKLISVLKGLYGEHRFDLEVARKYFKKGKIEIPTDLDEETFKASLINDKPKSQSNSPPASPKSVTIRTDLN